MRQLIALAFIVHGILSAPLHTSNSNKVVPNQYIVVLTDDVTVAERDDLISGLQRDYDIDVVGRYTNVYRGFTASMGENVVKKLLEMEEVNYVTENVIGGIISVGSWGIDRVDARTGLDDTYNPKYSGSGSQVYVLDTGIRKTHVDFEGRADYGWDSVDKDMISDDCHGHGTHCSGTTSGAVYGVAKQANVYGLRCVNCLGIGPIDWVIEAMDWTVTNGIHPAVVSMSLGYPRNQALDEAVDRLHFSGITVVAAAGNDDDDSCLLSPAGANNTFTVGATNINDTRAYFSSFGSCVDIFAPGVDITSAYHTSDNATTTMSGTSMACPHVAGAAALVLEEGPTRTADQVQARLLETATLDVITDVGPGSPNTFLYVEPMPV